MWRHLGRFFKSKLAVALLGAALIAGAGATVTMAATGGHLPLLAQGQQFSHDGNDDDQQAEGVIKSIDAANTRFVLTPEHGADVTVVVNERTVFEEGVSNFAGLHVGNHIEVKGTRQTDGSLLAAKIEGQDAEADDKADDVDATGQANELRGSIASLNAGNSTFVVQVAGGGMKTVHASSHTAFDGGLHGFGDLRVGLAVEVRGNLQADNTLMATLVHREDSGSGSSGSGGDDHGGSSTSGSGSSGSSGSGGSGGSGGSDSSGRGGHDDGASHS